MNRTGLAFSLCALLGLGAASAAGTQYVVVNLHPDEINEAAFEHIKALDHRETSIRLGAAAIFSCFSETHEQLDARFASFLKLSERYDVPIVFQPDVEQWWKNRPDLWNWWDESAPGYNPENRNNVEWIGWSPDYAIRIAWRDWGHQIRVLPPPNLMSPAYREACDEEMRRILPTVLNWWQALGPDRKDLFIGVKIGWESSLGINAFYYPDGNRLAREPAENDPTYGLNHDQLPARGVVALGYAAVKTLGLADNGKLTEAQQVEVVRRHLEGLCRIAAELGLPRDHLFTHTAGWKEGELLYDAALNPYACPGWSCYTHARQPQEDPGVQRVLQASDAPYWGAVEWFPLGAVSRDDWRAAIRETLALSNCRYLCIYNWRSIADNNDALGALEDVTCKE